MVRTILILSHSSNIYLKHLIVTMKIIQEVKLNEEENQRFKETL